MELESLGNLMMFQIVLGVLLIISPFVLGFGGIVSATTTNLILGVIELIFGIVGTIYFHYFLPGFEHTIKRTI